MGASLSSLAEVGNGSQGSMASSGLGDIPESCVACVFMHLTPPEICNLARLNRAFRGAASADSVWESKLPPNYLDLLALLAPEEHRHLTKKKDVFAFLSRPVYFDEGNKAFWLNRVTGGVYVAVSAKAMSITGIDDRRYWSWIPTDESRFHMVAFLQQIWWFEVNGLLKFPFPVGVYSLSFRLHLGKFSRRLGRRYCNYDHTHGWELKPVQFEFSTSDGQQVLREYYLDEPERDKANNKPNYWLDYYVGDFVISNSDVIELIFSMKQIDCTHSKGGLCVDSVIIIPSNPRERRRTTNQVTG